MLNKQRVEEAKKRMRYTFALFSKEQQKIIIEDLYFEGVINEDEFLKTVFKELKEEYE